MNPSWGRGAEGQKAACRWAGVLEMVDRGRRRSWAAPKVVAEPSPDRPPELSLSDDQCEVSGCPAG